MRAFIQGTATPAEFSCYAPEANSVFLIGRFDQPRTAAHPMRRQPSGAWSAILELPPGRYFYKFLIVYRGALDVPENRSVARPRTNEWN